MTQGTDYLDHSVFITRDYEKVWARYEELGFTLSPASRHRIAVAEGEPPVLGCTANRCAYFGENFIELIGVVDENARDPGTPCANSKPTKDCAASPSASVTRRPRWPGCARPAWPAPACSRCNVRWTLWTDREPCAPTPFTSIGPGRRKVS